MDKLPSQQQLGCLAGKRRKAEGLSQMALAE